MFWHDFGRGGGAPWSPCCLREEKVGSLSLSYLLQEIVITSNNVVVPFEEAGDGSDPPRLAPHPPLGPHL